MTVEHVARAGNILGEGPLWHPREKRLYWVDAYRDEYLTYEPATGRIEHHPVGEFTITLAFLSSGGLLITTDTRCLIRREGAPREVAAAPFDGRTVRFNDGRVDPEGRFFIGSMSRNCRDESGGLYRLDPDGSFRQVERRVTISNGLGWSPDHRRFYYTDSPRREIYVYDYDAASGAITNRRGFVSSAGEQGLPDGLCVDSEGCVWSARWGGWKVSRYDPDGRRMLEVPLPVAQPTSCAFGGECLDTLYITSAAEGLDAAHLAEHPLTGDLFCLWPGVRGQEEFFFRG